MPGPGGVWSRRGVSGPRGVPAWSGVGSGRRGVPAWSWGVPAWSRGVYLPGPGGALSGNLPPREQNE